MAFVRYIGSNNQVGEVNSDSIFSTSTAFNMSNVLDTEGKVANARPIGIGVSPYAAISGDGKVSDNISTVIPNYYGTGIESFANINNSVVSLDKVVDLVNDTLNIQNPYMTVSAAYKDIAEHYNRFKIPRTNLSMSKMFGHVFFIGPSCNILNSSGGTITLQSQYKDLETFVYAYEHSPITLRELSASTSKATNSDFMFTLSNLASGFSLNDEEIDTDTYGTTYSGYKINYGKHNTKSKTAGTISVSFHEDKALHVYLTHKIWVEYINACYRGIVQPTKENICKKILDYTGALYYIMTAEDGETILFWSKYYGIFPTNIPSTQYSWSSGQFIKPDTININYGYSFKEDFNPQALMEFNYNARVDSLSGRGNSLSYMPTFDAKLNHSGPTMVGIPFIVQDTDADGSTVYKLRYAPPNNSIDPIYKIESSASQPYTPPPSEEDIAAKKGGFLWNTFNFIKNGAVQALDFGIDIGTGIILNKFIGR